VADIADRCFSENIVHENDVIAIIATSFLLQPLHLSSSYSSEPLRIYVYIPRIKTPY
jgi:hypothetical protein